MKQITDPRTSFQLREPSQASAAITARITGQGELIRSFSNQIIKWSNGSKKLSSSSPYAREKLRNPKSTAFLKSRRSSRPNSGNSLNNSMDLPFPWRVNAPANICQQAHLSRCYLALETSFDFLRGV